MLSDREKMLKIWRESAGLDPWTLRGPYWQWHINSAYLSLCRVGMTRQSDSSIVVKPVKFARALHRDSVKMCEDQA